MLKVLFTPKAIKTLKSIPAKQARQIARKIDLLSRSSDALASVEIKGGEGFFRIKSGEYRIIYTIEDDVLKIWLVGKRNDDEVYRRFLRMRR